MRIIVMVSKIQPVMAIPFVLNRMGHEAEIYSKPAEELEKGNEESEQEFEAFLKKAKADFVISNAFSNGVARVTNRLEIKYAVWSMDSPTFTAWLPEADYDNCYLFYFDYREYKLKRQSGQNNAYHLPLAANIEWSGHLVITDEEIGKYGCDMSFVGGLYSDNEYDRMIGEIPAQLQNVFAEIIEKSAFVWDGRDRLHIPPEVMHTIGRECPEMLNTRLNMPDEYYLRTYLLGRKLTHVERTLLMELLAQQYNIHLYTWDTKQVPEGVRWFPSISIDREAPKVYYSSKINLNITLRSIASGVPLRIFDVMSVGGLVLSNWQEEIPELFVEDEEILTYKTPEELIDKADYYLRHDDKRVRIGINGYQKVKKQHTYEQRLNKIISILFPSS